MDKIDYGPDGAHGVFMAPSPLHVCSYGIVINNYCICIII